MVTGRLRRARQPSTPLHFLIHVPKTAGSTVNRMLARHYKVGCDHAEAFFDDGAQFAAKANTSDWMSGHLPFPGVRRRLASVSWRPVFFYGMVREPTDQVASHYNWLLEIRHRSAEFFDSHSPRVRQISARLAESDNDDPRSVVANLRTFPEVFCNSQSRIVVASDTRWSAYMLPTLLSDYTLIARTDQVRQLFTAVTGVAAPDADRENQATYRVDPSVFRTPEVAEFLNRHNDKDELLWNAVRDGSLPDITIRSNVPALPSARTRH